MSAMSASSPPAGLMPLSLIAEHKSSAPPSTAVQPLARTPEKCPPVPSLINKSPTVANGMEITMTAPLSLDIRPQPQEPSHPVTAIETPLPLPTPSIHYSNFPCADKAELPPDCPNSTEERGEESVAEAPVHEVSLLPSSASAAVATSAAAIPPTQPIPPADDPEEEVAVATATQEGAVAAAEPAKEIAKQLSSSSIAQELSSSVQQQLDSSLLQQFGSSLPQLSSDVPHQLISMPQEKPLETHSTPVETLLPEFDQPLPEAAAAQTVTTHTPIEASLNQASAPIQPQTSTSSSSGTITLTPPPSQLEVSKPVTVPRAKRSKVSTNSNLKKEEIVDTSTRVNEEGVKPKRKRLPTQPYQSPIPELNIIAKINKIDKPVNKNQEDKLIVFYRNEFLAVRNAEGGFYICQAMQNIYKSSSKIKIRWLSQETNSEMYTPDFYDLTDFDCILTNLSLERVGKNKFKLPNEESQRTQSILKRAIDIEKGLAVPEETALTEEHPDGLDLSLYRNEDQLKKKKKRKLKKPKSSGTNTSDKKPMRNSGKKTNKVTKSDLVKKIVAKRAIISAKRKTVPAATSVVKRPLKKSPPTPPTVKKEILPLPKKEQKVPSTNLKRKTSTSQSASPAVAEKKARRDPSSKTKSAVTVVGGSKGGITSTTTSAATRRTLRNSK